MEVSLSLMLNHRLACSHLLQHQGRQPSRQSLHEIVILASLSAPEPLLQPEGLVGRFAMLSPEAITLHAHFVPPFGSILHLPSRPLYPRS
jgi:hypothetical protein